MVLHSYGLIIGHSILSISKKLRFKCCKDFYQSLQCRVWQPFIHLTLDCILHFLTLSFQPCFPHHYLISDDQQSPQSVVTHPRNRSSVSHTRALMDTCIPHQHFVSLSMSAPVCMRVWGGFSFLIVFIMFSPSSDWQQIEKNEAVFTGVGEFTG